MSQAASTPASAPSTVLEVLNKTSDYFKQKGIANARLDAQLILAHSLGMKRLDLYLNFDRPLTETELTACREAVRRRGQREPLQHILGIWPFRELQLKVDKRALIPRPETEALVDYALRSVSSHEPLTAVDIGLGTGAIALSLMKERSNLQVYGTELSPDALALAQENAARLGLDAARFFLGSFFQPLPRDLQFDLIIANPPYIAKSDVSHLQPEVRDYDPQLALVGGEAGWEIPWELIQAAYPRLKSGGNLWLEVSSEQIPILIEQSQVFAWDFCGQEKDWSDCPRFIHMRKL
jgi:release factor glutamine methyltransferase